MVKYGVIGAAEAQSELVTTIGVSVVMADIMEATQEHNRQIDQLVGSVAQRTTDHQIRFKQISSGTLQPLDDYGNPKPTFEDGYYDIALPLKGAGAAWGDNRVSRSLMTVGDAARQTMKVLRDDADWMRRHILAAWFTDATYTYSDDTYGNLTVQPLANGDTVTYVRRDGTASTDNHFLAQENTISDSDNPFSTIYKELDEHPSNSGPYICWIPTNLTDEVEALTDLIEPDDPSLIISENNTRLRVSIDPDVTEYGQGPIVFGQRYMGRVNGVHVVEWSSLPDNYLVAHATGAGPFLGWREYPAAQLQGLFTEMHDVDGNTMIRRWLRYCGFGAMNRIAALAMRIGNDTYAEPTGYTAPLAV